MLMWGDRLIDQSVMRYHNYESSANGTGWSGGAYGLALRSASEPTACQGCHLPEAEGFDGNPQWSPDGSRIAFSSDRHEGNADVYSVSVE